jgi:hypothetical protein
VSVCYSTRPTPYYSRLLNRYLKTTSTVSPLPQIFSSSITHMGVGWNKRHYFFTDSSNLKLFQKTVWSLSQTFDGTGTSVVFCVFLGNKVEPYHHYWSTLTPSMSYILAAEYDRNGFNVLYLNILLSWPMLNFCTTNFGYLENLILFFIKSICTVKNFKFTKAITRYCIWVLAAWFGRYSATLFPNSFCFFL